MYIDISSNETREIVTVATIYVATFMISRNFLSIKIKNREIKLFNGLDDLTIFKVVPWVDRRQGP